ncbi:hypothetical protein KIN20_006698 [Parelaphostrongylus tenuis]|uniref:Uncharacterized protein n=1 Tax=Parelaphostrongylus tenuis TaxID=148309 RepID=A0AAD5MKT2_PARTN|nr:hypothetical protein KIN20_006698 [Parelaphostrongylus tenuis]
MGRTYGTSLKHFNTMEDSCVREERLATMWGHALLQKTSHPTISENARTRIPCSAGSSIAGKVGKVSFALGVTNTRTAVPPSLPHKQLPIFFHSTVPELRCKPSI